SGAIEHDRLVDQVAQEFGNLAGRTVPPTVPEPRIEPGVSVFEKQLEQVHLCLGAPGLSQSDNRRYAAYVLNTAFGAGMSSRLCEEVRERRGKAYSITSFLSSYRGAGYLAIYAGLASACVPEVVGVVMREFDAVRQNGLGQDELARAKSQIKGNMLLSLE